MCIDEHAKERFESPAGAIDVVIDDRELIRICTRVILHGECFAAPDQFGAAFAEMFPAAQCVLGGLAGGGSIPAFHGVDAPAVADDEAANIQRLGERAAL